MRAGVRLRRHIRHLRRRIDRTEPKRSWVLEYFRNGGAGAEVGVWRGDFSAQLLQGTRPRKLHLIDPWLYAEDPNYADAWYGGSRARSQADMDDIHNKVLKRFRDQIRSGQVLVHRTTSVEAAKAIPDRTLDWVYIDADHQYDHVIEDLELYSPKVRPGGVIAGDDYGAQGWWEDGVKRAVNEWIARGDGELLGVRNKQFVIRL